MSYGFLRVACASPNVTVANCTKNADAIIELIKKAEENNVGVLVLPELAISAYTCGDLFLHDVLLDNAEKELMRIAKHVVTTVVVVGLPLRAFGALYNCAAVLAKGCIHGIVPKSYIPNYAEFYEMRHFASGINMQDKTITLANDAEKKQIPFGTDLIFEDAQNKNIALAVEICEDMWTAFTPSTFYALNGATILANCSASNEVIGKAQYRKNLIASQSGRLCAAYLYADAGRGESTTDMVFGAHNLIAENGAIIAESTPFATSINCNTMSTNQLDENLQSCNGETFTCQDGILLIADIDTERLSYERRRMTSFAQSLCALNATNAKKMRRITLDFEQSNSAQKLYRKIAPLPFIPSNANTRNERCSEVITLQTEGLVKRLLHTNCKCAVIGLSGGLDSTLALLVTVHAFTKCNLDLSGIIAVTMPCFGTTGRTHGNAELLARSLGVTFKDVPIHTAVLQHFKDIDHDENLHDVTYENSQARERTQVLMDLANKFGGMVIGTGDLSELALGWATYNGDHMSMYGVNSSIPKTLVRHLVNWFADFYLAQNANDANNAQIAHVLQDILATPVSPELLPPEQNGTIAQKTEDIVGPYEIHDFVLYYFMRFGFSPEKILYLAEQAFATSNKDAPQYTRATILKWMKIFFRRFFAQQFKRSCLPDGAKVGTVSISPRGDWRMPSDADASDWLARLEKL